MFFFFFFFNDTATTEIYTFPYTTLFRSAARLVALGADDVEPAQGPHPLVLRLGDAARLGQRGRAGFGRRRGRVEPLLAQDLLRQEVRVATQEDVGAAPGHVGGDGDGGLPA